MDEPILDCLIVGGGPAGLTAAIYPADEAFFMRPLISAMATALAKNPPRVAAK